MADRKKIHVASDESIQLIAKSTFSKTVDFNDFSSCAHLGSLRCAHPTSFCEFGMTIWEMARLVRTKNTLHRIVLIVKFTFNTKHRHGLW